MTDELSVVADLRRQLRALPEPRPRRRAPLVAAAAAVLAAAAVAIGIQARGTSDAVAVTRSGDLTTIHVLDAAADPARLTAELREKGVDATIRARPVKPEFVGSWVHVLYWADGPGGRHVPVPGFRVEADEITFRSDLPVHIELVRGVAGG